MDEWRAVGFAPEVLLAHLVNVFLNVSGFARGELNHPFVDAVVEHAIYNGELFVKAVEALKFGPLAASVQATQFAKFATFLAHR